MERRAIHIIFLMIFITLQFNLHAEEDKIKQRYRTTGKRSEKTWETTRASGLNKTLSRQSYSADEGWQKYVRLSRHNGNLIETGWVNQGQLADGYIEGPNWPMTWPRGSGIEYGYAFIFFVAAEVRDAHGNTIHICSDRFHRWDIEQSPDKTHWYDFKPLPGYYNNHHLGISEWYIDGISEDVGKDGFPNTNDFGEGDGILQVEEDFNGNGVLDLSMVNVSEFAAMSNLKETWPRYWPPQSYEGDPRPIGSTEPGPAAGRWNGEYGYYVRADQESYYLMDDRENDEFDYYPFNLPNSTEPDTRPWPEGRRGLGITVEVRNYQWTARLAEDIMISIYDITNYGKKLNKVVVGMYNDVDVGGSLSGDEANFDTKDDITYVWEKSGLSQQGLPTGYFGFAFLESPGISNNRKDDDEDGLVDESQYNDLDEDGDWRSWEDLNNNGQWDTEDTNYNGILDEGEDLNDNGVLDWEPLWDDIGKDGIGPDDEGYSGPDWDGSEANGKPDQGEPNFGKTDNDESDQVGLTSWYLKDVDNRMANDEEFWQLELQPGTFAIDDEYTRDVAFSYGSGFIELETGKEGTQRYAIACLFGNDEQDIFRNKRTMQRIYDADYNFAKAPRLPLLTAVPQNGRVVLMWDNLAERSKDPIYGQDFEMYKIYKSTDPTFNDIKTISDAFGNPILYKPLVQFDLVDGLKGAHPVPLADLGVSYDMGTDSGLRHYYIDEDVTNGRTYYYAVVAVDKGYDDDFYERGLSDRKNLEPISPTETSAVIQVDPFGRPLFIGRNCAVVTPMEEVAGFEEPELENGIEHIEGDGSGTISLDILLPNQARIGHTYEITFQDDASFEDFDDNFPTGLTSAMQMIDITAQDTIISFDKPFDPTYFYDRIIHGFSLDIRNDDSVNVRNAGWAKGRSNLLGEPRGHDPQTKAIPHDYEIRMGPMGIDTSYSSIPGRARATNYEIYDVTYPDSSYRVVFGLIEEENEPDSLKGILSAGDQVAIKAAPVKVVISGDTTIIYTESSWRIYFKLPRGVEKQYQILPKEGDIFRFKTTKPFDRDDVFQFTIKGGFSGDEAVKKEMDNIYTVPDPYIAVSTLERRLVNLDAGRGQRRIDFVNIPQKCVISIFTISGRLVRTIHYNGVENIGRASWDLRTNEGLEVASGIYIYHVDAPGIGSKIGKLAIIK